MAAETAAEWDQAARAASIVDACTDMMRGTLRAVAETLFGNDLGDSRVRAGDLVTFVPYAIHRLPQLWSEPEAFRPERFEPGRKVQKNKFAYLPFGAGPRICLGASFAMIESQIIVGSLLSRFRVRLAGPELVSPAPQVTLRTSRPVLVRLEPAALA